MTRERPGLSWRYAAPALLALLWAFVLRLWFAPLFRPREWRGDYLFGTHHLRDIYLGVPLTLFALAGLAAYLTPRARRRAVAHRAFALALGIVVPLFAADVAFSLGVRGAWVANAWLDKGHISRADSEPDPERGFRRKPHVSWRGRVHPQSSIVHYRTDALGFRNAPGQSERSCDLAFVGDSYTEAGQVDEDATFVRIVGRMLDLSTVNFGCGAYGPQQELVVLEEHALPIATRAVVWQLFEGNDLKDAEEFLRWKRGETSPAPLVDRYLENSLFRPFLLATFRAKPGIRIRLRAPGGATAPMRLRYRHRPDQVEVHPDGLRETLAALEKGRALCAERGLRLVLLFIPVMVHALAPYVEFASDADRNEALPGGPDAGSDFARALEDFCAENGIAFVDVTADLRAAAASDPRDLFVPEDEHLAERGHRVVAEALARTLR